MRVRLQLLDALNWTSVLYSSDKLRTTKNTESRARLWLYALWLAGTPRSLGYRAI